MRSSYQFVRTRCDCANEVSNEREKFGRKKASCMKKFDVLQTQALLDWRWHWKSEVFALGKRQLFDARFKLDFFLIDTRVEKHVGVPPTLLSSVLYPLEMIIVNLAHVIAAIALSLQLFVFVNFAFGDFSVVKLIPDVVAGFVPVARASEELEECKYWITYKQTVNLTCAICSCSNDRPTPDHCEQRYQSTGTLCFGLLSRIPQYLLCCLRALLDQKLLIQDEN